MRRTPQALPGLAALVAAAALAATSLSPGPAAAAPVPARPVGHGDHQGLDRLLGDAPRPVRVVRDRSGRVAMVRSAAGRAMVSAPSGSDSGPMQAANSYLHRYGSMFGLGSDGSTADVVSRIGSAAGGTVVRVQQHTDGLPVFGGQLVLSLNADDGLLSMSGDTAQGVSVAVPTVSERAAERTAVAVTAKAHSVAGTALQVTSEGRWLYDPALVHVSDPLGERPVWRLEVTGGQDIRELVLVDTYRGSVALHYSETEGINRVVCDDRDTPVNSQVATQCKSPVRTESSGPSANADVNAAFDNAGVAAKFYADVAGIDLTKMLGDRLTPTSAPRLSATVRWCFSGEPCPMQNAFWDGRQMVYGDGYAAADDVVAHELTHGVIDHTSQLFYLHQSGAINESLADVIGEIVDHRDTARGDDDSAWTLGEDVPGGAIRSMKNPTLFGQPDKMTSPLYVTADINDDSGAVHANSGVGNKAAYLISQGGTFNGVQVAGIDVGDPMLTKTATLYTEVIKRLTSGSEYADLARVLTATCNELAAAGTAGFTSSDCGSVRAAVRATEMSSPPADPAAAAAEAPDSCPAGTFKQMRFRDDDGTSNRWSVGKLWQHAPSNGIPGYASSGRQSWFGYDPDPGYYGDPYTSTLHPITGVNVPRGQRTYLYFKHAYVFEWYDATASTPARYPDGGIVSVDVANGTGWKPTTTALSWVNGPRKKVTGSGTTRTGFGGDSHGYGSSRVDLTPLAGHKIRPQWTVVGDGSGSYYGWWLDDIQIYSCPSVLPSAPRAVTARGIIGGATLAWAAPSRSGTGLSGYRVTSSDGAVRSLPATATSTTFKGLPAGQAFSFTVAAVNTEGQTGPGRSVRVLPTTLTMGVPKTTVRRSAQFHIHGRLVRAGTSTGLARRLVVLQRRRAGTRTWSRVVGARTGTDGTVGYTVSQLHSSDYRLTFTNATGLIGSRSGTVRVRLR